MQSSSHTASNNYSSSNQNSNLNHRSASVHVTPSNLGGVNPIQNSSTFQQHRGSELSSSPMKSSTKIIPQPNGKAPKLVGQLLKRGNIFKRFSKPYNFTLDDGTLRVEKVGKDHTFIIDLQQAVVTRDKKSKRIFKIKTRDTKLTLKAADEMERELWFQNLTKIARVYDGEDVSKRVGDSNSALEENNSKKVAIKSVKTVKAVTLNQISDIL